MEEKYPQFTLSGSKQRIHELFGVFISIGTILLTRTVFHFEPSGMNLPINKERRLQYVSNLNAYIQDGNTIIWLDETNSIYFVAGRKGGHCQANDAILCNQTPKAPTSTSLPLFRLFK